MKKLTVILLALFVMPVFGQRHTINLKQKNEPFRLESQKSLSLVVESQFSELNFSAVSSTKGGYTELSIPGTYHTISAGQPQLPQVKKLIEIPYGAKVNVKIIDYKVKEYKLSELGIYQKLIPAQPSISKSADPDKVKFIYDANAYSKDAYTNIPLAKVEYVGQMRSVCLGRTVISPVQYNPVKNTIKVYSNIKFEIVFENADFSKTNAIKQATYSPFFEANLSSIVNYKAPAQKDAMTKYPVKYVIISDRIFETALAPFIEWKTKKGFKVITAYTDNIGTTTTSIKNYIKGLYDAGTSSDPAPTYVLFVGDVNQIPSFSSGEHVTDLRYCEFTGDDIPEIYYGRFSATNVSQLKPQIDKTLEYEQYTMPDPSFLNEVVLVAGVDANFASKHGNGQINYGTDNYFNSAHNITAHAYLYPESGNSATEIRSKVSAGCGFVNYTAHCSPDGWADPKFSISHISGLANANEYPLMIGNCCRSARFNETSFAEEILRAENKGAVGYIGGSDYTYWDEDFYFGVGVGTISANPTYSGTKLGALDCAFHENGEATSKWFVTNGQVMHAGNLAVTEGGSRVKYYWEIYHLMGDPSVMNYFSVPSALSVSYSSDIALGATSLSVTTEKYAYVAISKNGVLLDAKYSGNNTQVTLNFAAINESGTVDIVVTKQNKAPHIGTANVNGTPQAPVAEFSANTTTTSEGGTVQFTDESTNSPTSWAWEFEGGTPANSTEQNPNVKYNTAGTYKVILTATNSEGSNTKTKNAYITVSGPQAPVANFSASETTISVGTTINFTDNSSNVPTSWSWEFEGGTPATSTVQNPSVKYNTAGTYKVVLTATNSEGSNTKTKTGYITVNTQAYCESKGNSVNDEWISKVKVGSFEKSSNAAGYSDFTSENVNVNTGNTAIELTPGFKGTAYDEYWKIWVDLNGDGDFEDANELVFDNGSTSKTTVTGNINIPAGTAAITTRMRVSMKYVNAGSSTAANQNPQGPCESFPYGEVEDYTIVIGQGDTEVPTTPTSLATGTITATSIALNWNASTDNVGVTAYDVYKDGALETTVTTNNTNITGLTANTTYEFYVKAKDAAGNVSAASNTISAKTSGTVIEYCTSKGNAYSDEWIAKVNIGSFEKSSNAAGYTDFTSETISVSTGTTAVTLTPGFSGSSYNEYWKIWIDLNKDGDFEDPNELVYDAGSESNSAVSGNMNIPASAEGVTTRMRVTMKYVNPSSSTSGNQNPPQPCETFPYGEVEDYTVSIGASKSGTALAINEVAQDKMLKIYPNPAYSIINISFNETGIPAKIIDMNGRIILDFMFDNKRKTIDISNLNQGIYLLKLEGNHKTHIKQFIKK